MCIDYFQPLFSAGWCKDVVSINRILGESSLLFSLYLSKLLVYLHFVYLEYIIQLHPYSCCFQKRSICQVKCMKSCLKLLVGHALCIKLKSYSSYETLLKKLFPYHREGENTVNTCFPLAVYAICEVIISSRSKCHNLWCSLPANCIW